MCKRKNEKIKKDYDRKEIRKVILDIIDNYEEWTFEDICKKIQKKYDLSKEEIKEIFEYDLAIEIIE